LLASQVEPTEEQMLIFRLGFIFIAYRVDYWWWESIEMTRKFLMTCFLAFLQAEGPSQLAVGALITFVFLIMNLSMRPYCTDGLNNLQTFSLISQFLTLFCGILIGYVEEMAKSGAGTDSADKSDASVMGAIIVMVNGSTIVFPILRKFLTGKSYRSIDPSSLHLSFCLSICLSTERGEMDCCACCQVFNLICCHVNPWNIAPLFCRHVCRILRQVDVVYSVAVELFYEVLWWQ
jgi:hypothetical protein